MKAQSKSGFTLVEMMIVVAIVGMLAGISIPSMMRSRNEAQKNACLSNLREIDGAKQQWGMDNSKGSSETPAESDVQPYLARNGNGPMPVCPAGGNGSTFSDTYELKTVGEMPVCLIVPETHIIMP